MNLQIGHSLPDGILRETTSIDENTGCYLKPEIIQVSEAVKGRKIVIFGVPGAFTPTCSAQHLPGYIDHHAALTSKGVDEIWCVSVNDAFVMAAWGRERQAQGKVRMLGDGGALYTRQLGLEQDMTEKGLGIRSLRFAMIVDNGLITHLAVEQPGQFEVSTAEAILAHL